MIYYRCDKCSVEMTESEKIHVSVGESYREDHEEYHLCKECRVVVRAAIMGAENAKAYFGARVEPTAAETAFMTDYLSSYPKAVPDQG